MDDESQWIEKRAHPRVKRRFVMRVRPKEGADLRWEVPTLKDISLAGCYFFSGTKFDVGHILELEIQLPVMEHPMHFLGQVKRVEPQSNISITQYGVAIQFVEMEISKKDKLEQIINFSLKRQSP